MMISRRRYDHILALYPQSRGLAYALFEGIVSPIDWGIREARGAEKNARCLRRVEELFARYEPDVLVLQDVPRCGSRRSTRIHELHVSIVELSRTSGIAVRLYARDELLRYFAGRGATTKQAIAEMIAKHVPDFRLYVPPPRKPWRGEHAHMGIFEAAALAWMFFDTNEGEQQAA
jgi:hypothetical protein